MKIYKLDFNDYHYDQYDAFIVVANNKKEVLEIVKNKHNPNVSFPDCDWESGYTIKEIEIDKYKKAEILLGSFNAG